jgi:hypothetical protein
MWYIEIIEYFSPRKKNKITVFADKWVELENIILNEVSQVQKDNGHMFSLIYERQPKDICIQKYKRKRTSRREGAREDNEE